MRTAIVSDLHLGSATGEDIARDSAIRRVLLDEVRSADRLVLLGDALELRDLPLAHVLELIQPFFEELGEAMAGRRVVLVPGNHDHRLAEPLLEEVALGGTGLGLEHRALPATGPAAQIDAWLGEAELSIAYPGVWLRDDVYATHGHYLDVHLRLPRVECVAAAAVSRMTGALPDPATPKDYERILRPIYGLAFGAAQSLPRRPRQREVGPSEAAWELLAGDRPGRSRGRRLKVRAARAAFPAVVAGVNRLLRADFDSDISGEAIFRSAVDAATESAHRLGVDGGHVITGHTHRGGPRPEEGPWRLPGGGELHNTGNWTFSTPLHRPGTPPNAYWPGTVTWLEDSGPPRRVELLQDRAHHEMVELAQSVRTAASRR